MKGVQCYEIFGGVAFKIIIIIIIMVIFKCYFSGEFIALSQKICKKKNNNNNVNI